MSTITSIRVEKSPFSSAKFAEVTTASGTQRNWDRATLELEGRLLYRELEHLRTKSSTRALTYWESKRFKQVKADISKILKALTLFERQERIDQMKPNDRDIAA